MRSNMNIARYTHTLRSLTTLQTLRSRNTFVRTFADRFILPEGAVPDRANLGLMQRSYVPRNVQPKTAMEYIDEVPPIEIDGTVAVCDGG